MKQHHIVLTMILCTASFASNGCALLSKADPLVIRVYSPEHVKPRLTAATSDARAAEANAPAVELGRVTAGWHLREKVLHRESAHELGYYDDKRWSERPEGYVRRELARTLFEERGFRRVLVGTAPVLDVEVVAFEELRLQKVRAARIQLRVVLHDGRNVSLEETITIDKPAAVDSFDGFVAAMAEALDEAATQVAQKVEAASRPQ